MARIALVALVGLGLGAGPADAGAPRALGLLDALGAVGIAPEHRVAAAKEREAAASVDAAGAWPWTVVGASTMSQTARLDLGIALPLPLFGTLEASRLAARSELAIAAAEVRAGDLQLARDVASAWLALARTEARAELTRQSATREAEVARIASERFDAGDASRADVVLATAAAKRVGAQAAADAAAIDVVSAELAGRLGWDPQQPLHAAGGLPALRAELPAVAPHPEVIVAARRTDAQTAAVTETSRARWPHVALDLGAAFGDATLPGTDYRVGLTVEVPLLGHGGASVRVAESRLATARLTGQVTAAHLGAELVAARARFAAATAHVASLDRDVLPAQREAADLARAAFREGQTGLVLVLEAERALAEAEGEAIDARAEAATAYVELEWASGSLAPGSAR